MSRKTIKHPNLSRNQIPLRGSETVPFDLDAWFSQGVHLHMQGQMDQAQQIYEHILRLQPTHADALHFLGVIAAQRGNHEAAAELISRSVELNPQHPLAFFNLGLALQELGRYAPALTQYDRAIELAPDYAQAYGNRGLVLSALGQTEMALTSFTRAIELKRDYVDAYNNRGLALKEMGRLEEALKDFTSAIQVQPQDAKLFNNRGNALQNLNRFEDALRDYEQALALAPDYAEAHNNRGVVLQELNRIEECLSSYDQAIRCVPDHAEAHSNKAHALLLAGRFKEGWSLYQWRWKNTKLRLVERGFSRPLWLGDADLNGKTILLHAEQGLGDTVQFCRYATHVRAKGAKVVLELPASLMTLLQSLLGVDEWIEKGKPLPEFDFHCPLLSLPMACATDWGNMPEATPYLSVSSDKRMHWAQKLGVKTKPRIGIVWSSVSQFEGDHNRSMPLEVFYSSLPKGEFELVCLQKEIKPQDWAFYESVRDDISFWGDDLDDFADTAALAQCMDLVISTCTSVPHVTGALGLPTWILLSHAADWRWLQNRNDSPWYESVKLFRQGADRSWGPVWTQVIAELKSTFDFK